MENIFSSLRRRNFRLFFISQSLSLMGTWIQFTVQGWLVYRLTTSPFALGAVSFAGQATMLIFSLAGGALADRTDKRKALAATQFLAMLQALILGIIFSKIF